MNEGVKTLDNVLDKGWIGTQAGELEGAEALACVKIFQHVQKELLEKPASPAQPGLPASPAQPPQRSADLTTIIHTNLKNTLPI